MIYNFQTRIERFDDTMQNPGFVSVESVCFYFGNYSEIMPMLMAWYQIYGTKHPEQLGYNLNIEDGKLNDAVNYHRGLFRKSNLTQ